MFYQYKAIEFKKNTNFNRNDDIYLTPRKLKL